MDPSRPDRVLKEWDEVADGARRPAAPPTRVGVHGRSSATNLGGALVLVAAVVIAVAWLGRPSGNGGIGAVGSTAPSVAPTPTATASPSPSGAPTPTVTTIPTPTVIPKASATPAPSACDPAKLAARITRGKAPPEVVSANTELTNISSETCTIRALDRPQFVDGKGSVLIDGQTPSSKAVVILAQGDVVTTAVKVSNYCGPNPAPPVSVAFVQSGGGRFVATPVSSSDAVPPCNGAGQPALIDMHPWAR